MPLYSTPIVGSLGRYSVSSPFDTILDDTVMYTCQAVRSLTDMIAADEDPFGTIYNPLGILQLDFDTDVKDKVAIVTLTAGGTKFIDVPNKYIISNPNAVGKTYQSKALSINLNSLPKDDVDLTALMNDINALIFSKIGITPDITELDTSPEFKVDYDIHDANTAARKANISNTKSYKTKYDELLIEVNSNALYITNLEEHIKAQIP